MSEKGILKKIDDIFNYCEEIDNHLPKEEQTGYSMLPDIFYIRKEVHNLQQKVEQLEKENIRQKEIIENLTTMTVCGDKKQIKNTAQCKLEQLENIRKEAIEFTNSHFKQMVADEEAQALLSILNKGENNE